MRNLALLFLLLPVFSTQAANNRLTYSANLEAHSEDDEEVTSRLTLALNDEQYWSNFISQYDLVLSLLYDHRGEEDSGGQFEGFYRGDYLITRSKSMIWNFDADFEVLPEDSGEEVDDFESQNLTVLSTGPTLSLFRKLHGTTELTALVSDIHYSESELDSVQGEVNLSHIRPVSATRNLTLSLYYVSTEFDDLINRSSDYDASTVSLAYDSSGRNWNLELVGGITEIDNESDPDNQPLFEFNYEYLMNARSTIYFQARDGLETTIDYNRNNPTENNDLFLSSPLRSKRVSLEYAYFWRQDVYRAEIYTEEIEVIFEDGEPEEVFGGSLSFTRFVGKEWVYFLGIDVSENNLLDDRFESLDASVTYIRRHTSATRSEIKVALEADRSDETDIDDYILGYRFVTDLYK
jgi:hypothetical protein